MGSFSPRRLYLAVGMGALILSQSAPVQAQTYSGRTIEGQTQVDKAIGTCFLSVIGGGIIGGLLGGRRNAGRGVATGAAVGAGVCAVLLVVASNQDKARLRQMQLRAANSGEPQSDAWQTSDGHQATATVTTSPTIQVSSQKTNEELNCRRTETQVSVNGAGSDSRDIVCLQGDSWVTLDKLEAEGVVQPGEINL